MQMGTSVQAEALMELETLVGWSPENGVVEHHAR